MENYGLGVIFEGAVSILAFVFIIVFIVFLFYLYGTAKILKQNSIVDMPPWFFIVLELLLIFLIITIIFSLIIPIYIYAKSRTFMKEKTKKSLTTERGECNVQELG